MEEEERAQHGKSLAVVKGKHQQTAGDSGVWRPRMAEGLELPRKPGNAGGGKEP